MAPGAPWACPRTSWRPPGRRSWTASSTACGGEPARRRCVPSGASPWPPMPEGSVAASLQAIEAAARQELDGKHAARERALVDSRALIRTCANTIRAVHRHEFERAADMLQQAAAASAHLADALRDYQDLYWAGYVQDALKEYVEATATYRAVRGESLPTPEELGV